MKLRNLLLCGVCALSATLAFAEQKTFPFTLTTADGLPAQTSDAATKFTQWVSPTYTFDEPVSSFRLTVTHTSFQDAFNTNANGGRGYVFFTMGEFYLYDADGNAVKLTAENFSSNAAEAMATNDGCLDYLVDGDTGTHFHSSYNSVDADVDNPIGMEHWLEITLPEPMTSFSFGFCKRSNSANIPSEIIVTKGGETADPFAEYGFQLGEQVDEVEPGNLYVMCDNGNVEAYGGTYLYVAPNGQPGYVSTSGQTAYHVRRQANVDCIYIPVAAGDGTFYLKNFFNGSFVGGVAGFQEQADYSKALKLTYNPETHSLDGINGWHYSTNSQASFVGYENTSAPRSMYFYKASVSSKYAYPVLEKSIADAESALATYKEKFADSDDGETAALEEALAAAKTVSADAACNELIMAAQTLDAATSNFLMIQVYLFIDEIQALLDESEFGTTFGTYPNAQKTILEQTLEKLFTDVDAGNFGSLEVVNAYVANIQGILDTFYASMIMSYSEWPLHLVGEDGAVLFAQMEGLGNYIYSSPTFYLEEPVERIYITTVATNTGDAGGGWPCTNWAHFTLYDGNGEEVYLTDGNFSTNALEPGDGQGIPGICDYNEDGTPNLTTYMHTLYSSSDRSTNEHYICVEFPEPMNLFRFDLISRDNGRLVPTEMVIGSEPYHYTPDANVTVLQQITSASELDPEKYYMFYGNIGAVVPDAGTPSGFYAGIGNAYGDKAMKEGVFQLVPTEEEGAYLIHFLAEDVYLAQPTGWQSATSTSDPSSAGAFLFTESENLAGAFKVYVPGFNEGEATKFILQDWSGHMGYFTVGGEGFEADDKDGESDWSIYEVVAPVFPAYVSQIKKASEINTDEKFAMFGNLSVVSEGAAGTGFYRGVGGTVDGEFCIYEEANNYTLFKFEKGENGGYKIHFLIDDNYLIAPAGWEGASVTNDPAKAGEFFVEESSNLKGAFKIYAKGKFTGDNNVGSYTDGDAKFMVQDWGDNMGYYPIVCDGFADDDTDGESDWTLYKVGDPNSVVLSREDYLGDCVWSWDNYWANTEVKSFESTLEADPESEDGVILTSFNGNGPLYGTFDGVAQTITFPCEQVVATTDQWNVTFHCTDDNTENCVFSINLLTGAIKASGQFGIENVNPDGGDNGGWHILSSSWCQLTITPSVPDAIKTAEGAEVLSETYYTVGGQASNAPVQGINIVRRVMSDGTVNVQKVLVK